MRRFLKLLGLLAAILVVVAAVKVVPFVARVRRIAADPAAGFHADFYLYVSPGARAHAGTGRAAAMLVQPNNSGVNSDDASVHRRDAWWMCFERHAIADELGVVLLVPAFVRPSQDWRIYTHALDRDVLTTQRHDLARLDLQLIAMIDAARRDLAAIGLPIEETCLIQGFSASGMFANRFAALHPERVKAAAIGSPGGWPIAPVAQVGDARLTYPVGIADLDALVGAPFASERFARIPQLIYMGAQDTNDSVDFRDGYDEGQAAQVDQLFGVDPRTRWDRAKALYESIGSRAQFVLVDGVAHDRKALQHVATEFFAGVLNEASSGH